MPALRADILMAAVAVGELLVVVLAEKARERVPYTRDRPIFSEVGSPATAPPPFPTGSPEEVIVDVMAPEKTRQFG
jgi:hypothetical protein